ncbi:MAG: phosphatase PAP2 family protein [Solirubrobacteraceae bacterium]|nr:phosphatase PAP2 family protein [Solirubrobacteraceae bacterium]
MTATSRRNGTAGSVTGLLAGRAPSLAAALGFAALCAVLVIALRCSLEWVGPLPGDRWVLTHEDFPWLQPLPVLDTTIFFSVIASPVIAIATVLLGVLYAFRAEGARGAGFVVLSAAGVLVNAALKVLSGPTPLMVEMHGADALNYPSGHTVYAVVTFGALAVLARRDGRTDIALPLAGLAALMGPARVIAIAHFVSDVVAAYLVGFAWLAIAAALTLGPSSAKRR